MHGSLSNLPIDEQRAIFAERVGVDAMEAFDRGEQLDPIRGRRRVAMPTGPSPAPRSARVRRTQGFVTGVDLAPGVEVVDDHLAAPEEILAAQDARALRRSGESTEGGTYEGIAECARGTVPSGPKRNVDRNGRSKKKRGGGEPLAGEHWESERGVGGRPRKGKDVRKKVSVRAERTIVDAIAQTGKNMSDFLAEAAALIGMARSGAQGEQLVRAVSALACADASELTSATSS